MAGLAGFLSFCDFLNEPNEENSDISFYDYFLNGVYKVIQFMRSEFNLNKVNTLGYCIGGTLQALFKLS